MHIFIVDDDPSFGKSLKRMLNARALKANHFESAQASKQKQAQEAAKRQEAERQQMLQQQQQQTETTLVLEIQKSLVRMGFDPGDVNGQLQTMTVSSIKQYEVKHGLLETGKPSPELHKHMLRNGG